MKNIIAGIGLMIFILILFILYRSGNIYQSFIIPPLLTDLPVSSVATSIQPDYLINLDNQEYAVFSQKMDTPDKLILIPNFEQKLSCSEIVSNNHCRYGINGSFYTPQRQPVGLFVNNGKKYASLSHSQLLNGFLILDKIGQPSIVAVLPKFEMNFVMQSGPLFFPDSMLNIQNDEPTRRSAIAYDNQQNLYLLAITKKDAQYSGPLLSQLPTIIKQLPLNIVQVLNLDGGSASCFFNDKGGKLTEFLQIGSFLCGQ